MRCSAPMTGEIEVRAAGGVVLREGYGGLELLVVHRPRYDDWSLPKGKLDEGEAWEEAALREVREETGLRCELGAETRSARYVDRRGRNKLVRYWLMRPVAGEFEPNDEVDAIRWLSPDEARGQLTYEHDRLIAVDLRG